MEFYKWLCLSNCCNSIAICKTFDSFEYRNRWLQVDFRKLRVFAKLTIKLTNHYILQVIFVPYEGKLGYWIWFGFISYILNLILSLVITSKHPWKHVRRGISSLFVKRDELFRSDRLDFVDRFIPNCYACISAKRSKVWVSLILPDAYFVSLLEFSKFQFYIVYEN